MQQRCGSSENWNGRPRRKCRPRWMSSRFSVDVPALKYGDRSSGSYSLMSSYLPIGQVMCSTVR